MARTFKEISQSLADKDSFAEEIKKMETTLIIRLEQAINQNGLVRDNFLGNIVKRVEDKFNTILKDAEKDFKESIEGFDDKQKAIAEIKFEERKESFGKYIEAIKADKDKAEETLQAIKEGKFNGDLSKTFEGAKSVEKRKTIDNDDKQKSMTNEEGSKLVGLMQRLIQARQNRRALDKARRKALFREIREMIEQSGSMYLHKKGKIQELKDTFDQEINKLEENYNLRKEELEAEKEPIETRLVKQEANLAQAMSDFNDLKKYDLVVKYEKARDSLDQRIVDLQFKKKSAVSQDDKDVLNAEINNLKVKMQENKDNFYATPLGQEYKKLNDIVRDRKLVVNKSKEELAVVENKETELDNYFEEYVQKYKARFKDRKALAKKDNKFLSFIGKIRAKLGIGKYKDEKNVADLFKGAIEDTREQIGKFGHGVADKTQKAVKGLGKFFRDRQLDIVKGLERFMQNKIERDTQKLQKLQDKSKKLGDDGIVPAR